MLKLGIAGIGVIANIYIALISQGHVKNVEISALCSRNESNCQHAIDQHQLKSATIFTDYISMLDSNSIDAVLICTPHPQHPLMTIQALERDIHVLVEKPVGSQVSEVEQAVHLLEQRPNLVCGVMYNRRMSAVYQKAKELLVSGTIGNIKRVSWLITNLYRTNAYYRSSPWRGKWSTEGGGLLMTQASHQLDLLQWLCGVPSAVMAECHTVEREIEVENEATLLLRFPGGFSGQFIASGHEYPGSNRLEIAGSLGTLTIIDDKQLMLHSLTIDEGKFANENNALFGTIPYQTTCYDILPDDNLTQQAATLQNFADAISGKATISCSLQEGLSSLKIIQSSYQSSNLNQWITLK